MELERTSLLSTVAPPLREALFSEYNEVVTSFYEGKWRPSELSAGRFCEIVLTVIQDLISGTQSVEVAKFRNLKSACQQFENQTSLPEGLRLHLIPFVPILYGIRNRRNVGHFRGDIDPSVMDASFCVNGCGWVLAELIRSLHDVESAKAKEVVDNLTQIKVAHVWVSDSLKRYIRPDVRRSDEALILISSEPGGLPLPTLMNWMEVSDRSNARRLVNALHDDRLIEAKSDYNNLRITPKGAERVKLLVS